MKLLPAPTGQPPGVVAVEHPRDGTSNAIQADSRSRFDHRAPDAARETDLALARDRRTRPRSSHSLHCPRSTALGTRPAAPPGT
jgi:hypothetical protein